MSNARQFPPRHRDPGVAESPIWAIVREVTPHRIATAARAVTLTLAMASASRAALWVSPGGDDRSPGTEEQPLRTLERARDVVRSLNHDMADDLTVFIAGEHHLGRAVEFGPADSGTNGYNIVYTAAPGEHPVLSGALRVTGWTVADRARNLWSAPSPDGLVATHDLYVDGMVASRTQGRLLAVFASEPAAAATTAPDPKAQWKNPDDVVFRPPAPGAIWSERKSTSPTFVENAFELLGVPGEWYFDRPALRIYYTPRAGENMAAADVEAVVAPALIWGTGSREQPITGLVFKGIRFEYTATADAPRGEPLRPRAAVSFANAAGIQFLEDDFLHMGTPALDLGPGIEGGTVEGCMFGDISWSALGISNAHAVRIAESRFSYAAADHVYAGAVDVDHSDDVAIEHDQFDHIPTQAIAATANGPHAVRSAANRFTLPMIGLGGAPSGGPAPIPAEGAGIAQDFRSLAHATFSSAAAPRPPTGVSADAEDEFAYVTWIPSCRDGGSPVETYTVEASTGSRTTVTAAAFQQTGYVMMNGLANGRSVNFTVAAANARGAGPPSLPTANVTPRQKRKLRTPTAPASVAVTPGAAGATVEIRPPSSDGGSPVISYLVAPGPDAEPVVIEGIDVIRCDAAHPVVRSLPGFRPAQGARISIVAVNAAGEGKAATIAFP